MIKNPDRLYHYASIEAFKGIIDSKSLRMTKYDLMNDPQEVEWAKYIIKDSLIAYNCPEEYTEFKDFLLKSLEEYKDLQLYVASFSEEADYLEQWRAYTPNGGVSIGFDFKELNKGFIQEHMPEGEYDKTKGIVKTSKGGITSVRPPGNLYQCKYDTPQARRVIKNELESWFSPNTYAEMFTRLQRGDLKGKSQLGEKFLDWIFHAGLGQSIYNIVGTTKHKAYSGEREWRWININPATENFSQRLDEKNRLYVTGVFHPCDCIKEVWTSPHGDKRTIRCVVEHYKEKYELDFIIHESTIPYRLQNHV